MNDIGEEIKNSFLEHYSSKTCKFETIEEFFKSYTKDELISLISLASLENDEFFSKLLLLNSLNKDKTIKFVLDNYEKLYDAVLVNMELDELNDLSDLLDIFKNGIIVMNHNSEFDLRLKLIQTIDELKIGKINYSKKKEELTIMIPKEIRNIIINKSNNKSFVNNIVKDSNLKNNIEIILNTYGIINGKKIIEILKNTFKESCSKNIEKKLLKFSLLDENINICQIEDDYLLYNLSFLDEDDALTFYYSLDSKLDYKIYTKKEYEDFYDFKIINNLVSYKNLVSFLIKNFDMDFDDIDYFKEFIIHDYIYSYQKDENEAKSNLHLHLKNEFYDLKLLDESKISNYINNIAKHFPNYNLKGNTYL